MASRLRRLLLSGPVVLALLARAGAASTGDSTSAPGEAGATMPKVDLAPVGEKRLAPGALDGKLVLYEFWATWCMPCHVQVEVLEGIYPRWRERGVEFVGVATGEPEDVVADYLAQHPSVYPVLLDPDEKLGTALEILGLPTLVVVDRSGKIAWRHTGLVDADALERAFSAAGAPRSDPAATAATTPMAP